MRCPKVRLKLRGPRFWGSHHGRGLLVLPRCHVLRYGRGLLCCVAAAPWIPLCGIRPELSMGCPTGILEHMRRFPHNSSNFTGKRDQSRHHSSGHNLELRRGGAKQPRNWQRVAQRDSGKEGKTTVLATLDILQAYRTQHTVARRKMATQDHVHHTCVKHLHSKRTPRMRC